MMRFAVCDPSVADAQELVVKLQHLASDMGIFCTVDSYRSARLLLEVAKTRPFDAVFLETEIGSTGGIELARKLRFYHEDTEIVFVTAKEEYALAAYGVFPLGYVLKRAERKRLYPLLSRLMHKRREAGPTVRCMTVDGGEAIIPREALYYIEVIGNRLFFHGKGETVEGIGSLSAISEFLPEKLFYRAHRNFIVNLQYVRKIGHYYFEMQNGDKVTVAKNRYTEAKAVFEEHFGT
ncbi:MAG: response regulator transcription factor [Ruminococcaceae bacterium]|nr:response regulator transcription factor [Oscillospiraceae bacterium]